MNKRKRLEEYQTALEFSEEFQEAPWGNKPGPQTGTYLPGDLSLLMFDTYGYSRLAIPRSADNYQDRVRRMFNSITSGEYNNLVSTYQLRDSVLGNSENRVSRRTLYAAPDGSPDTAYSTGMEVQEETAPMHENVDRAQAIQDYWRDVNVEAVKLYAKCFLGVIG